MYEIEYDRPFEFEIQNFGFGDLSKEEAASNFKDGRKVGLLLELQLCHWFPELIHVDQKGYDHVDGNGHKYDQKCFTKGGLRFMPSNMIGAGRTYIEEEAHSHANEISYIACDVFDFPRVRVMFKRGSDLVKEYPNCSVPFSHREKFFS